MTGSSPLVSVVTPFFNTAEYLPQCIDSVRGQDYDNFEYILVDNCSTDGSAEIAAAYAESDSRIRLIRTTTFLDQVANYNSALQNIDSASAYTKIVQADDWIFPECLSAMVRVAEEFPSAKIVAAYRHKGGRVKGDGVPLGRSLIPGREACRLHLLQDLFLFGSPTSVLFRSDVVRSRSPFYGTDRLHEDTEACYDILRDGDLGFVHQVLTVSRTQDDSVSGEVRDFNPDLLDLLIVLKQFGQVYLTAEEYRRRVAGVERRYHDFLGEEFLRRRGSEQFWDYHRRGLASIQETLPSLWFHAGRVLITEYLLCPRTLLLGLLRRIRRLVERA